MQTVKKSAAGRGSGKGNFADPRNGLLPLFSNSDASGEQSWREVFGYERPKKPEKGRPFNALEARQSSSGSKSPPRQ